MPQINTALLALCVSVTLLALLNKDSGSARAFAKFLRKLVKTIVSTTHWITLFSVAVVQQAMSKKDSLNHVYFNLCTLAKQNRLERNRKNSILLYQLSEVMPRVGDVLVRDAEVSPEINFDNFLLQQRQIVLAVVIRITPDSIEILEHHEKKQNLLNGSSGYVLPSPFFAVVRMYDPEISV
jgi:hypothetical protein